MKGKKLAVGAALVAVPSLALAAPAAADRSNSDDTGSDLTFTLNGTPHFCNLYGLSSFLYDEELDRTSVQGETEFRGEAGSSSENRARCREAVINTTVTIHWLDGDDRIHGSEGTSGGSYFAETSGFGPGDVDEVNGNHVVRYFCDSPDGLTICTYSVATSPSTK